LRQRCCWLSPCPIRLPLAAVVVLGLALVALGLLMAWVSALVALVSSAILSPRAPPPVVPPA
jgi:hypothetical protein